MFLDFEFLVPGNDKLGRKFDELLKKLTPPAEFFYSELGLDELNAKVQLNIAILHPAVLGQCSDLNIKKTGNIDVTINGMFALDPLTAMLMGGSALTTLAHEMIHAHQMASGDLRTCEHEQMIYWKGKPAPEFLPQHLRHLSPWEKEAMGGMYILADMYLRSIGQ